MALDFMVARRHHPGHFAGIGSRVHLAHEIVVHQLVARLQLAALVQEAVVRVPVLELHELGYAAHKRREENN